MRRLLLLILAIICISPLYGQYIFENLKPKDGLSSREVRSFARDKEGFVWIGTINGLNRFDGSQFKIWNRTTPGYPAGLGDLVSGIIEYGKRKIWFTTNQGVAVLDKATQQIMEIPVHQHDSTIKTKIFGTQLLVDKSGRLWMSSQRGIFIEKNDEFVPVSSLYPFAKELDNVLCPHSSFVYDSLRNSFWIGTTRGLYYFDPGKKLLHSHLNNPEGHGFFNNNRINSLVLDPDGNLWYSNATEGSLNFYDLKTRRTEKITRINNDPEYTLYAGCDRLFFDSKHRLWISTWLFSSFIRHPNGVIENIPYNKESPTSIGYGIFHDAMEDSYGNIWLATINGVSILPASGFVEKMIKTPSYPHFLPVGFTNVNVMKQGTDGGWWMGKMEGLIRYDTLTKQTERFIPPVTYLRWREIIDLDMIGAEWWCSTYNGVWIYNPITKKWKPFSKFPKNGQAIHSISWVHQDTRNNTWIAVWGDGIYRYDPMTEKCIRYGPSREPGKEINTASSYFGFETSKRQFWVSVGENGIASYDYVEGKFTIPNSSYLKDIRIPSMAEDGSKNLWISTEKNGFIKCDLAGNRLDSITLKDGVQPAWFFNLQCDVSGRLWACSRHSLVCIEPKSKKVSPVRIEIDFSFNDHWNSLHMQGNRLYATMLDNLVIINTNKFQTEFQQTPPLLSGFTVFQEEMAVDQEKGVQLSHKQNFFSINFSSPFHREVPVILYAYKLEGFDKDWVYPGREQQASYTNVPSGNYVFKVKSTDGSSAWMETLTTLPITIKPPFYKTGWFLMLIVLLAAGLGWWFYKLARQKKNRKNIENTIDYFANSVYGENSVNEICWDIARNCISQLQFKDCVVYLLDKESGKFIQKAAYGPKNPKGHEIANPLEIAIGEGIVGTVAATGKPLLVRDTSNDSRYIVDDEPRLSELAVPILHDNQVIGIIDSEHPEKNFFTEEHLKALTTIASISANKIAEAQAESYARENEIKLLEINKMLAESQLMALRAQMNPHFVFNCLNSIQECIVTQKYGEASKYLNKFSKLFRMVLNNSGKNLVSLQEEKEVLELYLELEQMRFEKSFSYELIVDEELEIEDTLIPSMLLQPYVENALWHGLMHKEGDRHLLIKFTRLNDETFQCTIQDNGIGRQRSYELKAQQSKAKRHESKGLKISKDRIEVLQKQGHHATLSIMDNYDSSGRAAGTEVIIEMSSYLKN